MWSLPFMQQLNRVLVTDLLDAEKHPASELLEVYLKSLAEGAPQRKSNHRGIVRRSRAPRHRSHEHRRHIETRKIKKSKREGPNDGHSSGLAFPESPTAI